MLTTTNYGERTLVMLVGGFALTRNPYPSSTLFHTLMLILLTTYEPDAQRHLDKKSALKNLEHLVGATL